MSSLLLVLATGDSPLTIDDALALAARKNAELEVARADRDAAAADYHQSFSGVLPRLDLTGSYEYQLPFNFYTTVANSPVNQGAWGGTASLDVSWTFFDGLGSWNLIDSTRLKATAAVKQYAETELRVAYEVTRRFYEVAKQERALQVRRDAERLSQELVERADALFKAGRGTKADTFNARVNLGNDQLAVKAQMAALVRARADLAVVLGLSSDAALEIAVAGPVSGAAPPSLEDPPPLAELLGMALKARPLLAADRLSADATEADVTRAQAAYWPTFSVSAQFQYESPQFVGTTNVPPDFAWFVGVGITGKFNIYAGGETRAGVERAQAQARRARATLEQARETVSAEVTVAREQVVTLAAAVTMAQAILDAADRALQFTRDKLEAGLASQLEVRDAAAKLAQARLTWVNSVVDLVVARADLNRAVGGSL